MTGASTGKTTGLEGASGINVSGIWAPGVGASGVGALGIGPPVVSTPCVGISGDGVSGTGASGVGALDVVTWLVRGGEGCHLALRMFGRQVSIGSPLGLCIHWVALALHGISICGPTLAHIKVAFHGKKTGRPSQFLMHTLASLATHLAFAMTPST